MMFKKSVFRSGMIVFALVAVMSLCLGACNSAPTSPTNNQGVARGGIWIDDLPADPDSFLPNVSLKNVSYIVDQALYAPLFYGDASGNIHAGLVREIPTLHNGDISTDLKTWTFHLRPHLLWSDGAPLDASDVDFTWKLWTNPAFNASNTYGLDLIKSTDLSIDNLTITFHLKKPFAPFLSVWTDGLAAPLPVHQFNTVSPEQILHSGESLNPSVTSGPFMMSESVPGNHYTVIRNPNYYRASEGLPYLDKVIFRVSPDAAAALHDFQTGKADSGWFTSLTNLRAYQRLRNYTLVKNTQSTNFEAIYFNFHNTILANNLAVREAITMSIDRQSLIRTARQGQAVPLCSDQGAALHISANVSCPKFDPAAANALLDQNGWVRGSDGYRTKNRQKLEFHYATPTDNSWGVAGETIVQQNLKAVGIKLDIKNYSPLDFYNSVLSGGKAGTYDIAEFENNLNYDPDDSLLFSCGQRPPDGFNISFYCNPTLDALYTQERATIDPTARQAIFNQIHSIYLTDFPFIPLYSPFDLALAKKGTHNYMPAPEGALETINIWEWWCDGGTCPA